MKLLFAIISLTLVLASLLAWQMTPERQTRVPLLYWVTEQGAVRAGQKDVFDRWIARKHAEDPARYPLMELQIDPANNREEKMMIQGVTGVAGDILSGSRGSFRYFRELGMLTDVTDAARRRGFDPTSAFPQLYWEMTMEGRQYGYPMNVTVPLFIVNRRTFRELGVTPPEPVADKGVEAIWSLEEFEAKGREFVAAVRRAGRSGRTFFLDKFELLPLRRSLGLNTFNETGTACVLDDPRYVESLNLMHRWTHVEHFFPSAGEQDALQGGIPFQFMHGGYGMFMEGSWVLEQLRPKPTLAANMTPAMGELTAVPLPYERRLGLPNTILRSRIAMIYSGSRHKAEAEVFLEFLASPEYARQLVDVPDSLPPNPRLSEKGDPLSVPFFEPAPRDEQDRPIKGRETELAYEAEADAQFAWAMRHLAVGTAYSPFVLPARALQIENDNYQDFIRGKFPAQRAAALTTAQINAQIRASVKAEPRLAREYERRMELQARIDAKKAAGEKIPLAWLDDPFYRKYYVTRGMAEGPGPWWAVPGGNMAATRPATGAAK